MIWYQMSLRKVNTHFVDNQLKTQVIRVIIHDICFQENKPNRIFRRQSSVTGIRPLVLYTRVTVLACTKALGT